MTMGKRELLAVKLALEEWLKGAQFLFTIHADHKILVYLQKAKWLNPRQAWWTLFSAGLSFHLVPVWQQKQ